MQDCSQLKRGASLRRWSWLVLIAAVASGLSWQGVPLSAADTARDAVRLVIDYGDGVEIHFTALPWRAKMTAYDALAAAGAQPHGVPAKFRGGGVNTFVTQIGDVKNEGGGRKSRNWLFSVNGEQADVGVGAYELKPKDTVLWKFEVPDYNQ